MIDKNITVAVSSKNDAPTLTIDQGVSMAEDNGSISFDFNVTDIDGSIDNITVTVDDGNVTNVGNTITFTPTANFYGDANITVTVTDDDNEATTQSTIINVTSVNDAPIISGTPNTTVDMNVAYSFIPNVIDVDDSVFIYSILNTPDWGTFNEATGELNGTPEYSDAGTYTDIEISVKHGEENVSLDSFNIIVVDTTVPDEDDNTIVGTTTLTPTSLVSITLPTGIPNEKTENDSNVTIEIDSLNLAIDITELGKVNIVINSKEKLIIEQGGADINITSDNIVTIVTPSITNIDGTTSYYIFELSGNNMTTTQVLTLLDGTIVNTTTTAVIENATIELSSNNEAIYKVTFENAQSVETSVELIINSNGAVSTSMDIDDKNTTYLYDEQVGSTIIMDESGDIVIESIDGLDFTVDSNTGTLVIMDKNNTSASYEAGSMLLSNGDDISKVEINKISNNQLSVDIVDDLNNTITSTISVLESDDVEVTISDTIINGAIVTKVKTDTNEFIEVDNYLDGRIASFVNINDITTNVISSIKGADINITANSITTMIEQNSKLNDEDYTEVVIETNNQGETSTKFIQHNSNGDIIKEMITQLSRYKNNSDVTVYETNGLVFIETITQLDENIKF